MASIRPQPQQGPPLAERSLFDDEQAERLELLFKTLANRTRLRISHALHRAGELNVSEVSEEIGMSQQAVSNQLQRLADRGIVKARRDGNHVYYRIVDPCLPALMDLGVCLIDQNRP